MSRAGFVAVLTLGAVLIAPLSQAFAQACQRQGDLVTCADGRVGTFVGDGILWPDGTRSRLAPQSPSVVIGHKDSVQIGQGVFVGNGRGGSVPLDPSSSNKRICAVLDGVSYCH